MPPFSRGPNSVDILRQSQTLGTGVNTNTLFNGDDVINPSSNDEAEEEDNSPRISYRRLHIRGKGNDG
jgi:hypothetical protein